MSEQNLYCTLFVDASLRPDELLAWTAQRLDGAVDGQRSVSSPVVLADVLENDEADREASTDPRGGFLFYAYRVEVDPAPGAPHDRYVQAIRDLLRDADARGWRFAASCDFEDDLPRSTERWALRTGNPS